MTREELVEKYGAPVRIFDDAPNVLVFAQMSEEGAEAFAAANRAEYGHPSFAEEREGGWVTVTDLNPAIKQFHERFKDIVD